MTEEQKTEDSRQNTECQMPNDEFRTEELTGSPLGTPYGEDAENAEKGIKNTAAAVSASSAVKTEEITTTVESVVEAVLFASDESLTEARLANIVETSTKQVRQHIKNLESLQSLAQETASGSQRQQAKPRSYGDTCDYRIQAAGHAGGHRSHPRRCCQRGDSIPEL
jgi:hypothetical protein